MLMGGLEGDITKDEFVMHFKMIAVKVPAEDDFVKIVAGHVEELSEDKAEAVFKDQVDHLIFLLRQRLLTLSNDSQEEY